MNKSMKYEIKKLDFMSTAVIVGIFYGLIGVIPLIFGLVALVGTSLSSGFEAEYLTFLFFPLGFFLAGFIIGLFFVFIYNKIAEHWSGIKMEIDYKEE